MLATSVAILTRLRDLIAADGRSPEALSLAVGRPRAWCRRRLDSGEYLRLCDLDAILGALGVDLDALIGAPPSPSPSATNALPSSTDLPR